MKATVGATIAACLASLSAATALAGEPVVTRVTVPVEHVRIEAAAPFAAVRAALDKSLPHFDERLRGRLAAGDVAGVRDALEAVPGPAGLMIFSTVNHGDWLAIRGRPRDAVQYLIGNLLVATELTTRKLPAALYAPLRVVLYETEAGETRFEYDRPSTLLGQYDDPEVTAIGRDLDGRIERALLAAARSGAP